MPKLLRPLSLFCLSFVGMLEPAMATRTDVVAGAAEAPGACGLLAGSSEQLAVQVPFEVVDGRIYVQVGVNGRGPFRFAVDTGASGIGRADTALTSALALAPQGRATSSDGVQTAAVDTVHLDSLALGGLVKKDVEVITRDYGSRMPAQARFHGILALDFFADGLLVLDYPRNTLSFSRTMSLPPMGEGIIGYERAFRVPVSVAGVRTEANLDTGANVSFVMPRALYTQVSQAPLVPAGAGTLTNTRIETWRGTVPGPVTIGAATLSDVAVRVADSFPEMLVGAHVLREFVVLIDQRVKRIALCRR